MAEVQYKSYFDLTSDTPYLALTGELYVQDSKVHGAHLGPAGPDGPHVGPMNLAIRVVGYCMMYYMGFSCRACVARRTWGGK